jgi:hypothetical protein
MLKGSTLSLTASKVGIKNENSRMKNLLNP